MAIQFAALDSHLYSTSANFTASTVPFSISVWINAVWNGAARLSMVALCNGTSSSGSTTSLQIGTSTGAGEVSCWTYGGLIMVQSATGVMTAYNNTWANITYTYDGTTHSLYVNGALINTGTTAQIAGTFDQVWLNGYPPSGSSAETSSFGVDSFSYFSRTLSANEALTIFNAGGQRHGIINGLLARYEFDELGQGVSVASPSDQSGNGNTLSFIGAGAAPTYSYTTSFADSNIRSPL